MNLLVHADRRTFGPFEECETAEALVHALAITGNYDSVKIEPATPSVIEVHVDGRPVATSDSWGRSR